MSSEISLEPMEENEEIEKGVDNLELDILRDTSRDKSIAMMKRDLSDYRKRMGNKGTYKGWLAHIVPENLKLDKNLEKEDNEYIKLWEESTRRLTRKRQLRHKRNQTGKKENTIEKDVKEN